MHSIVSTGRMAAIATQVTAVTEGFLTPTSDEVGTEATTGIGSARHRTIEPKIGCLCEVARNGWIGAMGGRGRICWIS